MNFAERIKNLWNLSNYVPTKNTGDLIINDEVTAVLVKKPEKQTGRFIPRVTVTPAEEITQQPIHEN
jgi:hypothetical protein